jgi:DNA-binding protein H-NS
MARTKSLENMSATELAAMQARIERIKIEKQNAERAALREKIAKIAKDAGFDISDLIDGRKGKRSKVAVKYRDPDNPENTWTWSDAALAGSSDQGRKGEERGFPGQVTGKRRHPPAFRMGKDKRSGQSPDCSYTALFCIMVDAIQQQRLFCLQVPRRLVSKVSAAGAREWRGYSS